MPRFLGRLLAALLLASPMASASMIRSLPEEVLNRPASDFNETPQFGPKFHLERGPEIVIFPRHEAPHDDAAADMFSLTAIGITFALCVLASVPRFQRMLLMLKLMD